MILLQDYGVSYDVSRVPVAFRIRSLDNPVRNINETNAKTFLELQLSNACGDTVLSVPQSKKSKLPMAIS